MIDSALSDLAHRADYLVGAPGRRLFLLDSDDGTHWIRPDLTPEEGDQVADFLASCLYRALKGTAPGEPWFFRLYDDGKKVHR